MTSAEQRAAAKAFAEEWKGRGYEKGESQIFWLAFLRDIFGIEKPEDFICFEEQVHLDGLIYLPIFGYRQMRLSTLTIPALLTGRYRPHMS